MWVLESLEVVDVNQAALLQYGYSRQEFLGMTVGDLSAETPAAAKVAEKPRAARKHRRKDGSFIDVELTSMSECQKTGIHEARRVLIIDDNVSLAENIAEILQIDGHVTDIAASAEEAFSMALESEPDVVVTDYRLPGISGVAFVKQFRCTWPGLLAVVVSAYTDERTVNESRDAGATFMAKPIDFKLLTRLVRSAST